MVLKRLLLHSLLLHFKAVAKLPLPLYGDVPAYDSNYSPTIDLLNPNVTEGTKQLLTRDSEDTGNIWVDYSRKGARYYKMWLDRDQPDTDATFNIPDNFDVKIVPASGHRMVSEYIPWLIRRLNKPGNIDDYIIFHFDWPKKPEPDCQGNAQNPDADGDPNDPDGGDPNDPHADGGEPGEADGDETGGEGGDETGEADDDEAGDRDGDEPDDQGGSEPRTIEAANFDCMVSVKEGVFVALSRDRGEDLPYAWKFSQIGWWIWKTAVEREYESIDPQLLDYTGLDYFFSSNVLNEYSEQLIEIALREEEPPGVWWFKPHASLNQDDVDMLNPFWALLGSPTLASLIFMLMEHKRELRGKSVRDISVYWSQYPFREERFIPRPVYIPDIPSDQRPDRPPDGGYWTRERFIMWADLTD